MKRVERSQSSGKVQKTIVTKFRLNFGSKRECASRQRAIAETFSILKLKLFTIRLPLGFDVWSTFDSFTAEENVRFATAKRKRESIGKSIKHILIIRVELNSMEISTRSYRMALCK